MCRVISVASLGSAVRDFVDSFGGDGIYAFEAEDITRKEDKQKETEVPSVKLTRTVKKEEGGLW